MELKTQKSNFPAFGDSLATCEIKLIPEVLDRLIIEVKFDHVNDGQEILKDMEIKIISKNEEQKRIFDIYVTKYIQSTMKTDEKRINNFKELSLNSKYRDFSYTVQPQYKLDKKKDFELIFKAVLSDTIRKTERTINRTFKIENNKEFKIKKFRVH